MFDPHEYELWTKALKEAQKENNKEENKMETNGVKAQVRPGIIDLAKKKGYGFVECTYCGAIYKVEPEYAIDVFEHRDGRHLCPSCGKDLAFTGELDREFYFYGDINQLPYVPPLSECGCCCEPDFFKNDNESKDDDDTEGKDDNTTAHAIWVGFFKPETYTPEEACELLGDNGYPIFLIVPTRDGTHGGSYEDQNKGVFDIGQKFISALLESDGVKDGNDRVVVHFFGFEISEIFNSPGLYTLLEWCKEETGSVTIV